ncbi:hypothetical protein CHARACLAT_011231 [Characodon lateralis]|uniref:Uncharacterized protein n=1 Tax=Characodon lateralis TaxID=208331 RepID=A0ABU7D7R3_9TELE|nr:hypothetical protein [Characodon lateralis]
MLIGLFFMFCTLSNKKKRRHTSLKNPAPEQSRYKAGVLPQKKTLHPLFSVWFNHCGKREEGCFWVKVGEDTR